MTTMEHTDTMRGRFIRLRRGRALELICNTLDMDVKTLHRFLRGEDIRVSTLLLIEDWCDAEEGKLV